jgi:hypothetical protein
MKYRSLFFSLFIAFLALSVIIPPVRATTLEHDDFQQGHFAKTVDFFDYARAWATVRGMEQPPNHWQANTYMTYINHDGFQMIYAGLENISFLQNVELTIPMQTILMHFKTQESQQEAIVASSFLMVMGFNDSEVEIEELEGTPDKDDNLWASFSLGINLTELFPDVTFPAFNNGAEPIALVEKPEVNGVIEWTWGMRYVNLTALWVTLDLDNEGNTNPNRPFGLATYDELTFKYTLTLDNGVATLHKDYVMGRMHDLFVFGGWFLVWPIYNHYNATGCYRYNALVSDQTIYEFLDEADVSMSIVEYQKTILMDKETTCTVDGEDVTETEVDATNSPIETHSEDGELICSQNFATKPEYQLFNHITSTSTPHAAEVRTHEIQGYTRNRNLFQFQTSFEKYIPLILVGMYPGMFARARDTIGNIDVCDALYVISYPAYSGYKIDHDPVLTAYYAPTQSLGPDLSRLGGALVLAVIAIPIIVVIAFIRKRRAPLPAYNMCARA